MDAIIQNPNVFCMFRRYLFGKELKSGFKNTVTSKHGYLNHVMCWLVAEVGKSAPSGCITSVRFLDLVRRNSFTQPNELPPDVVSSLSLVTVKERLSL